ncbi:MAG TPA: magnesium-translocating P-type ATPase [Chloroflexi bacterium]|nr:magnesium-translocating P-type ATPase [Chloroflexota bacterium]
MVAPQPIDANSGAVEESVPAPSADTGQPAGLTTAEAQQRLAQYGRNELISTARATALVEFLRLFRNPLVDILLVAAVVSLAVGETINATIIVVIVLLSMILDFVQTYRSQRAADTLMRSVAPRASVERDGVWVELLRPLIVPGDLIRLSAGDLVPADARLLHAVSLHVQEAALTGESMPVDKIAMPGSSATDLFLGTSVISGSATAVVTATGAQTTFGEIVRALRSRPPETEFERGIREFSILITRTIVVLVLVVVAVNLAGHHGFLDTLLFAIALAVGLTPEFLPMITTVTLTQGAIQLSRQHVIVKHLAAIEDFGSVDVLCSDKTGTLTSGTMTLAVEVDAFGEPAGRPRLLAQINSRFQTGINSPLDDAILRDASLDTPNARMLDEIPFDFERRRLSVIVDLDGTPLLISKGAPEGLLDGCVAAERGGVVVSLDNALREQAREVFQRLSGDGYRVLAIACRTLPAGEGLFSIADERDLTLAGYLAFLDPPLPDVAETVAMLAQDGVALKILTGDNDLVARHVCEAVGIDTSRVVLGDEIERMSDAEFSAVVQLWSVFARVSPAQKQRIILALKASGHVVGFLGDGVNDAPSLHAADVGISVMQAVDVAKDASDIILLKPSLRVLHDGILEGRKAFGNLIKYILMGVSSNFGNMFSMAAASAILPFLPMLPGQVLLNNFLYDLAQITIPTDHVDPSFSHKPRRWDIKVIRNFMIFVGPVSSIFDFLTFFVLLRVLDASEREFHTGWFVESLITQTLVLLVIRTAGNPFHNRPSRPLFITLMIVVITGIALPFTPIGPQLGFTPLPAIFFLFLVPATAAYLLLVEVVKRRILRWD